MGARRASRQPGQTTGDEQAEMVEQPWIVRDANAGDRNGIIALWLENFWESECGKEFRFEGGKTAFWRHYEPRVKRWLARPNARVRLVVQAEAPEVFCAFVCVEGSVGAEDVIHYMMAKRCYHRAKESAAMFRALLGDMMTKPVTQTLEIREFNRAEVREAGLSRPKTWILDPYFFQDERRAA
jgi:hypothetical protein